ncbi:hypothetical protein PUNSTDRAFT_48092 [Punctularia strigosozonata HHB-11173 SS5]|uniref:Uncharacterized protein n=1 Tax=Punctularia strigosozonata (strain HHB-11173) TaxID=741275 RepID=R7RZD4_PUNST|nr:uncharacterized protein PUNSTDRAFT_48092 [Punctularia strigosozonata HHB-11173 SS5]EIN03480.1 hypothetical protein PUNSTDRAFT_48092 [Punctularia strigosozonata HHB-11173 SS5]
MKPKPTGRARRAYSVIDEMGLSQRKEEYNQIMLGIRTASRRLLDITQTYGKQDRHNIEKMKLELRHQFPILKNFEDTWPVDDLAKQALENDRAQQRKVTSTRKQPEVYEDEHSASSSDALRPQRKKQRAVGVSHANRRANWKSRFPCRQVRTTTRDQARADSSNVDATISAPDPDTGNGPVVFDAAPQVLSVEDESPRSGSAVSRQASPFPDSDTPEKYYVPVLPSDPGPNASSDFWSRVTFEVKENRPYTDSLKLSRMLLLSGVDAGFYSSPLVAKWVADWIESLCKHSRILQAWDVTFLLHITTHCIDIIRPHADAVFDVIEKTASADQLQLQQYEYKENEYSDSCVGNLENCIYYVDRLFDLVTKFAAQFPDTHQEAKRKLVIALMTAHANVISLIPSNYECKGQDDLSHRHCEAVTETLLSNLDLTKWTHLLREVIIRPGDGRTSLVDHWAPRVLEHALSFFSKDMIIEEVHNTLEYMERMHATGAKYIAWNSKMISSDCLEDIASIICLKYEKGGSDCGDLWSLALICRRTDEAHGDTKHGMKCLSSIRSSSPSQSPTKDYQAAFSEVDVDELHEIVDYLEDDVRELPEFVIHGVVKHCLDKDALEYLHKDDLLELFALFLAHTSVDLSYAYADILNIVDHHVGWLKLRALVIAQMLQRENLEDADYGKAIFKLGEISKRDQYAVEIAVPALIRICESSDARARQHIPYMLHLFAEVLRQSQNQSGTTRGRDVDYEGTISALRSFIQGPATHIFGLEMLNAYGLFSYPAITAHGNTVVHQDLFTAASVWGV